MATQGCLIVREPGLLTTVQDEGRWGWQHVGVPVGGPMDDLSFRRANRLVGNGPRAAVLEITLVGPTLDVVGPVTLAVAGAAFDARLDGRPFPHDTAVHVDRRAVLVMGQRRSGARAYLAVRGGLDTPLVLGSRSTSPGVPGTGALREGDVLPVARVPASMHALARQARPAHRSGDGVVPVDPFASAMGDAMPLRVLAADFDGHDALAALCRATYAIGPHSNRMGYRLRGPRLRVTRAPRFPAATAAGMVQVPPDGQPILLMADRQTTGGYPVVAVVITADLPRAGQLAPGDRCTFTACTRHDAMAALLAQQQVVLDG